MTLNPANQQAADLDALSSSKRQDEIDHKVVWDDRGVMRLQASLHNEASVTLWSSAPKSATY